MSSPSDSESTIKIYIHSQGITDPRLVEVQAESRVATLLSEGESLWLQDGDEPIPPDDTLHDAGVSRRSHLHLGRCLEVEVVVRYGGEEARSVFPPAACVVRAFRWAAGPEGFGLPAAQLPKHGLAVPDGDELGGELLDWGVHIGSLVRIEQCTVTVDLLPRERFAG